MCSRTVLAGLTVATLAFGALAEDSTPPESETAEEGTSVRTWFRNEGGVRVATSIEVLRESGQER